MSRCAIYARFSSDRQRETSAEDQVRICRERADREGWTVVEVYTDLAISGASNRRPGMTAMLSDAAAGSFDVVVAEALDRIGRDQEAIAGIYKRLRFAGVGLVTLADGDVNELHIGLKGTMDALELRKMAEKIRRGARGALERHRIPGGLSYGYAVLRQLRPDGELERGLRRVVPEQAEIIRRIYAEYLSGRGSQAIAHRLNAEGVAAPRGGEWRASTIVGAKGRANGILNNPTYVGRFVWNRVRMLRDPETSRRVSRTNAEAERLTFDFPELAIVDQATWDQVQAAISRRAAQPLALRRRPRHFLSGLIICHACGGTYTSIDRGKWGCTRHRQTGTCDNGRRIRISELEARVLSGLKEQLLSPEAVQIVVREYHLERERARKTGVEARSRADRVIREADAAIARLVAAIAEGGCSFAAIKAALESKQAERDRAAAELAEHEALPVIALHPQIAQAYRQKIESLTLTIAHGDVTDESSAGQVRSLIDRVVITPGEGEKQEIEVFGSLSSIIAIAEEGAAGPTVARALSLEGRGAPRRGRIVVAGDSCHHRPPPGARSFKA